jgi:hypothetical protein
MTQAVIAGVGFALPHTSEDAPSRLATQAAVRAVADAGLNLADIDGLLTNGRQPTWPGDSRPVGLSLQRDLQLRDLRVLCEVQLQSASATTMVQMASLVLGERAADAVVCVYGDAPRYPPSAPEVWLPYPASTLDQYLTIFKTYADAHGVRLGHLLAVVESARRYACGNPLAAMGKALDADRYLKAQPVLGDLRAEDCAPATPGAVAFVLTRADRDGPQPPVHVAGWAQRHQSAPACPTWEWATAVTRAMTDRALAMAGLGREDVAALEATDPFSPSVLLALEGTGFCEPGQAAALVADGGIGPSGVMPVNTGGGQLAALNLRDFTAMAEAVMQVRGRAGQRQIPDSDVVLVAAESNAFEHQSAVILSNAPTGGGPQ